MSYYPSGLVRSSTDAFGWTVAYANYTADGEPQLVSRRFCAAPPASTGQTCGQPLAGWSPALGEAAVAAVVPQAFRISYDEDAAITCIRDVRGTPTQDDARFVGFIYDDFGNVLTETSPWRRDGQGDVRIRRATTHRYDPNGNLLRSERDRTYRLGRTFAAGDCSNVEGMSGGTRISEVPEQRDLEGAEYDALDRVVLTRTTSNNIDGSKRRSRTEYDLVGNVTRQTTPNHEEGVGGFDYTTTTAYDDRDRPFMVTDGERRRTCTYYDAYDNPAAVTPARWQGRETCPPAPDLTRSTFATFNNAGNVVSSRSISGKVTFTLTDEDGNAIRSEDVGGERVGRKEQLQTDLRVTRRTFDDAGNLVREQLPPRQACVAARMNGCKDIDVHTPATTNAYDALNRLISTRTPRQNRESALSGTSATRYQYDGDGRRIRETLAGGSEADRIARTKYDPFGNVISTTLPNSGAAAVQERFETTFTYGDDDALIVKNDRPHDVFTSWGYDRRGLMVSRTDHGTGAEEQQWDATHEFSYWPDGSLRSAPITVAEFAEGRVYADGTCLRQPGTSATRPRFLYLVLGDQQLAPAGDEPNWKSDTWRVGEVRRTGRVRLRKLKFDEGVIRSYDHNGQLREVEGCGRSIAWTRRDGVGAPLRIVNQDGGETRYRYGTGGELVEEQYPDGRSRAMRYVTPDADPFTVDPGAGLEEIVALDRPNLRRRYLQMAYIYTLDGAIDVEGRARSGQYSIHKPNNTVEAITSHGFTTYEYDHVGALTQTRVTSAARLLSGPPAPPVTARPRNLAKAAPVRKGRPVGTPDRPVALAKELAQEDVIRDVAGNPRRVTTTVLRANVRQGKASRTQTRLYTYDVLDRLASDDVSTLPGRTYRYDGFGRMDRITVEGQVLEDSRYSEATRGSMLLRSKLVGLPGSTRQLTTLDYGNGRIKAMGDTLPGPRGQLVRSTTYDGATASSGLDEVVRYGFTSLNQQGFATELSYEPLRERQSNENKARKKTESVRSYMHYDLLGRRTSTSDYQDDLTDAKRAKRTATLSLFTGSQQDPYAESTSDPKQPASRWILRHQGRLVGELRGQSSRYLVGNHQGTTQMTLDGTGAEVVATFDNDTWGEPLTGPISLASGTPVEKRHNIYGYTGMREANAGQTTHHQARDYRSDLKSWLQTDQYMDPWKDVGLSLDPMNRNRSQYAASNPVAYSDPDGHKVCVKIPFIGEKCTTADETIAAVVDTTVKAVTGDTSPTPVRSILPTGSLGGLVTVTPPKSTTLENRFRRRVGQQLQLAQQGRLFQLPGAPYPQAINPWTLGAVNIYGSSTCDPNCLGYFSRADTGSIAGRVGYGAPGGAGYANLDALADAYKLAAASGGRSRIGPLVTGYQVVTATNQYANRLVAGRELRLRADQAVRENSCLNVYLHGNPPSFDWRNTRITRGQTVSRCW